MAPDNLARGSPLTAEVRVRRLGAFCSQYKMRPGQIIDIGWKRHSICRIRYARRSCQL